MVQPITAAITKARTAAPDRPSASPAPYACAANPVVPMRTNANVQKRNENTVAPTATAPMSAILMRPTIAVSTIPTSGTVKFDSVIGSARRHIGTSRSLASEVTGGPPCHTATPNLQGYWR